MSRIQSLLACLYMEKMKKNLVKALVFLFWWVLSFSSMVALAQTTVNTPFGDSTSTASVTVPGWGTAQGSKLIDVIKSFINWMLGMLALIALIILLRGGFQMVTAAGDDAKYKKGFKILQQAAIGLVFIWVSRLVVSVIFRLLGVIGVQ